MIVPFTVLVDTDGPRVAQVWKTETVPGGEAPVNRPADVTEGDVAKLRSAVDRLDDLS